MRRARERALATGGRRAHDRAVSPAEPPDPMRDAAVLAALRELGNDGAAALRIGGIPVADLARRFGTPFYALDAGVLAARAGAVQQALGPRVRLLYSIKANPGVAVTAQLRALGVGAEIASLGELEVALAAGHAAGDLRFAGPGKTDAEITASLQRGLGCFHAESASEVDAIAHAARALGRRADVAVRVNPPQSLAGSRLRMGGHGARFGVDEDQVGALLQHIAATAELRLRGLHVYGGTQSFDAAAFAATAVRLCAQARQWERDLGLRLDELDLGGGFGVPTYLGDPAFELAAAARAVQAIVHEHDRPGRSWFVELGRFLLAPAGVYVARVVRKKCSGDRVQLALDGGLHHCAIAAGLGSVLRRPPLLVHAGALRADAREAVAIGGPLCTPQDQFADEVLLPPCREGDLIAVLHAGAYGQSFSPTGFLSHPAPCELLVQGGNARIVRARGEPADVLRGQSP